jgi:Sec-independent protein translocase protein TatA
MGRILFYGVLIFLVYNLIFKLILPIYRATRHVKKGFRDMQDKMNEQMNQQSGFQQKPKAESKKPAGDYIDFEEIKD